jgi:hypothetical protein
MFFQRHRIPQYLDHHCPHVRHQATPRAAPSAQGQLQPTANQQVRNPQYLPRSNRGRVQLSTAPIDGGSNRFSRGKQEHFPRPSARQGAFHRSCRVPPRTMIVMWRRCRSAHRRRRVPNPAFCARRLDDLTLGLDHTSLSGTPRLSPRGPEGPLESHTESCHGAFTVARWAVPQTAPFSARAPTPALREASSESTPNPMICAQSMSSTAAGPSARIWRAFAWGSDPRAISFDDDH